MIYFYKIPSKNSIDDTNSRVSVFLKNKNYISEDDIFLVARNNKVILELVPEYLFKDQLSTDVFIDDDFYKKYKSMLTYKNIYLAFSFVREMSPHTQFLIPILKTIEKYPELCKKIIYFSVYDVKEEVSNLCKLLNITGKQIFNIVYEHFELEANHKYFVENCYKKYNPDVIHNKNKLFVSINCKPEKFNRLNLALLLYKHNLLNDGIFKLNKHSSDNYLKYIHKELLKEYAKYSINWNDRSEIETVNINGTHTGYPYPVEFYNSTYISLVSETHFDDLRVFHTEKTYRTIANEHPFIYLGPYNSLKDLHKKGYKTFSPFIDETYDTITEHFNRLNIAIKNLKEKQRIVDNYQHMKEISKYNVEVLKNRSTQQIEMIEKILLSL